MIRAECRRIVDNHPTEIQAFDRLEDAVDIASEDAHLQTEFSLIGMLQRFLEIITGNHGCHRSKDLFSDHFHIGFDIA